MNRDGTSSELDRDREAWEDRQQRLAEIRAEVYRHNGPEYALLLLAEIDYLRAQLAERRAIAQEGARVTGSGAIVREPIYPPRLLTRRAVIATVAERWHAQYYRDGTWGRCMDGSAQIVYDKLVAIDLATAPRAPVDAAIGNTSWTAIQCDCCQRDVEVAAEVGQLPDYDSATVTLCADCIALAAQLVAGA